MFSWWTSFDNTSQHTSLTICQILHCIVWTCRGKMVKKKKQTLKRDELGEEKKNICWRDCETCSGVSPPLSLISICCCQPLPQSGADAAVLEWGRASPVSHKHTQIIYMLYSSKATLPHPRWDLLLIWASNIASQSVAANLCNCQECD